MCVDTKFVPLRDLFALFFLSKKVGISVYLEKKNISEAAIKWKVKISGLKVPILHTQKLFWNRASKNDVTIFF